MSAETVTLVIGLAALTLEWIRSHREDKRIGTRIDQLDERVHKLECQ